MISQSSIKISLIGAGNVAWNLAKEFYSKEIKIGQVYSQSLKNAKSLCKHFGGEAIDNLSQINNQSNIYIIAVPDDAIVEVAKKIDLSKSSVLVHTSGSVSIDILKNVTENYGSFYPLQTFTKNKEVNFREVNVCVEGNNKVTEEKLIKLAGLLSNHVYSITSEQRSKLHLAAVFANNFSNYMLTLAQDLCNENEVDFNLLFPLITETFEKNKLKDPFNNQTGPAKRNDSKTIEKHYDLLASDDNKKEIYTLLTNQIIKRYHD